MNQDNDRFGSARGYRNMNRGYENEQDFHRNDWADRNDQGDDGRDPYQHAQGYDWNRGGRYDGPVRNDRYEARDARSNGYANRDMGDYRGSNRGMASYQGSDRSMAGYCPHCNQALDRQYTGSDDRYYDRDDRGRNDYDRRWMPNGYEQDRRGR
ncbi:MAG TPA: hypothetical protein VGM90_22145 [Kofleriaceae bacterium]|jgi:hypothetical protein